MAGERIEAQRLAQMRDIAPEPLARAGIVAADLQRRQRRRGIGRRHPHGEDPAARLGLQRLDQRARPGNEAAAGAAQRLRQRAGQQQIGRTIGETEKCCGAGTSWPDHAGRMRLVDHQQRVELARQRLDLRQWRRAALHAEDAVGDDQPTLRPPCPLQRPAQAGDATVLIGLDLGPAEPAAIDDAGVVQPVGDDDVAGADQGRQHPAIGVAAGGEQRHRLDAEIGGKVLRQRLVQRRRREDRVDSGAAAIEPQRLIGRGQHTLIGREAEIVVGAEHDRVDAVEQDASAGSTLYHPSGGDMRVHGAAFGSAPATRFCQ